MIIKRIYLKNIRSFDEIEIFPSAGVNFIKGENGAGKSTIIESIGFALFGAEGEDKIGNYFLQYGKDKGLIEVTFTAKDGSEILVKKQISAKGTDFWRIYENGEDTPATLLAKEVQSFISSAIGLSTLSQPDWIFSEVIGIRQGSFKRPFEDAPSARIDTFDRIFGVQEYKKTYEKMSNSLKEVSFRINNTNVEIEYLKPQAGKTVKTQEDILDKKKELSKAETRLSFVEKQYRDFENLSKSWQLIDRKTETLSFEKARIKSEQEELNKLLFEDQERFKIYQQEVSSVSLKYEEKSNELKKEESAFEALINEQKTIDSVNRFINEKVVSKQIAIENAAKSAEESKKELFTAKEDLKREKEILELKEKEKSISEKLISLRARRKLIGEHEDKLKVGICPFYEDGTKCEKAARASTSYNADIDIEIDKLEEEQESLALLIKQLPDIDKARLLAAKAEKSYEDYSKRSKQLFSEVISEIIRAASWDTLSRSKEILDIVKVPDSFISNEVKDIYEKSACLSENIKKGDESIVDSFLSSINAFEVFIKKLYLFEQEKIENIRKEEREISDKKTRLTAEFKALETSIEKAKDSIRKNEENALKAIKEEEYTAQKREELTKIEAAFGQIDLGLTRQEYWRKRAHESAIDMGESKSAVLFLKSEISQMEDELKKAGEAEKKLAELESKKQNLEAAKTLLGDIRSVLKEAGPKIASVFKVKVNSMADSMYKTVSKKAVTLEFTDNYDVLLIDSFGGHRRERYFRQLSGGEKMTAALAIRMSLLKSLGINFGFFDEPTDNLDVTRRENLSDAFKTLLNGFEQVFLVSHDDTFDSLTDEIIIL